jgi:hypothetical protein
MIQWKEYLQIHKLKEKDIPEDLFSFTELVLDNRGNLLMQNRLPGQNEVRLKGC